MQDMEDVDHHAQLLGHQKSVTLAQWNPQANFTMASASMDCTVKIWDI
jgi:WD40 repeat protein